MQILLTSPTFSNINNICTFTVVSIDQSLFKLSVKDQLGLFFDDYSDFYTLEFDMETKEIELNCYIIGEDYENVYSAVLTDEQKETLVQLCTQNISATVSAVAD